MRQIEHIVIHCAATPNGRAVRVRDIDAWHRARGFKRSDAARARQSPDLTSIGYHYVIYADGTLVAGRHVDEIGAHVAGSNARSIGICMVGTDRFSPAQWDTLARLVVDLRGQHPQAQVLGHRDFSPDKDGDGVVEPWEWTKTCPGFDVRAWLEESLQPNPDHVLEPTS